MKHWVVGRPARVLTGSRASVISPALLPALAAFSASFSRQDNPETYKLVILICASSAQASKRRIVGGGTRQYSSFV